MKTKLSLAIFLCLLMTHRFTAQTCNQPPSCIQNGDLTGPTAGGNMNSSVATTVPNWFVSHGTPTHGGPANTLVWMWSYGGNGEGIYTCYNFIAGRQYKVCLKARYAIATTSNPFGDLKIDATTGLNVTGTIAMPTPATSQVITSSNITNTVMTDYSYVFTANSNYKQLWIRPYQLMNNGSTQYAVDVDNIHIEDLSLPDPVITISPTGPFTNGVPVNLTASGGPSGTIYTWLGGHTGSVKTVTPNCFGIGLSVSASYNWCPTPGVAICQRTTSGVIDVVATLDCCARINTSVFCNGQNAMMNMSITNTSSFAFNAYRLHLASSGAVVGSNNSISIPLGSTGGPYSVDLTALGLTPGSTVCFYLEMLRYGNDLCPEEKCQTQQFCVTVPQCHQQGQCCKGWGNILYNDYSNPSMPFARIVSCGDRISIPCGNTNGFYFNYNCDQQCQGALNWELINPAGAIVGSGFNPGAFLNLSGLSLTTTGQYRLRVTAGCGVQSCGTCELLLDVNCGGVFNKPAETPKPHSIVPNPASNSTTIFSNEDPIKSYVLQSEIGAVLSSKKGLNQKEVSIDLHAIPNGIYTLIVNDTYTYKVVKQE